MLNENLLKSINDTIEGIMQQSITYDDLDMTVDYILENNDIYRLVEDEEGEEVENTEYEKIEQEVKKAILKDERIQLFETGIYAYEGNFNTLNVAIICNAEYDNPFETFEEEI